MNTENKKDQDNTAGDNLLPINLEGLNYDDQDNLGLDADRSSDNISLSRKYNMDNDMISNNPEGEDDLRDVDVDRDSSLKDK